MIQTFQSSLLTEEPSLLERVENEAGQNKWYPRRSKDTYKFSIVRRHAVIPPSPKNLYESLVPCSVGKYLLSYLDLFRRDILLYQSGVCAPFLLAGINYLSTDHLWNNYRVMTANQFFGSGRPSLLHFRSPGRSGEHPLARHSRTNGVVAYLKEPLWPP